MILLQGREDGCVFVVMTLLGKDLSRLRRERKTRNFSMKTSIRLGILTLSAIQELHKISVISRLIELYKIYLVKLYFYKFERNFYNKFSIIYHRMNE